MYSHVFEDYDFIKRQGFHKTKKLVAILLAAIATSLILLYVISSKYIEVNWYFVGFIILLYVASTILFFIPEKIKEFDQDYPMA